MRHEVRSQVIWCRIGEPVVRLGRASKRHQLLIGMALGRPRDGAMVHAAVLRTRTRCVCVQLCGGDRGRIWLPARSRIDELAERRVSHCGQVYPMVSVHMAHGRDLQRQRAATGRWGSLGHDTWSRVINIDSSLVSPPGSQA